jgi:hypothetical protein
VRPTPVGRFLTRAATLLTAVRGRPCARLMPRAPATRVSPLQRPWSAPAGHTCLYSQTESSRKLHFPRCAFCPVAATLLSPVRTTSVVRDSPLPSARMGVRWLATAFLKAWPKHSVTAPAGGRSRISRHHRYRPASPFAKLAICFYLRALRSSAHGWCRAHRRQECRRH